MTGDAIIDVALFVVALGVATVIAAAEFALDVVPRSRLETLIDDRRIGAERCLRLKDSPEDVRAAVQISTTFLIVVAGAVVAPSVQRLVLFVAAELGAEWLVPWLGAVTVVLSAVIIAGIFVLLTTLVAMSIGTRFAEAVALRLTGPLNLLTRLFTIPRRALTLIANILLKPFGTTARFREQVMSEENLMDLLEEGAKSGILDQTEHDLIESIFEFTDTTAGEIMVPRKDIVAIEYGMTPAAILERVLSEGFTRMPVYRGSIDRIIGVVYAKDVVSLLEHSSLIVLDDIIRPPFFVPESKPISELLRDFQRKRIHLAVVVDEFGGTEGIITLEDIIEEIVGDIRDEYDEEARPFDLQPDGTIEVDASTNISDLNDMIDVDIPESDEYDTVGGYVMRRMARIPVEGDVVEADGLRIEVLTVDERRIKRVRIRVTDKDGTGEADVDGRAGSDEPRQDAPDTSVGDARSAI